MREDFSVLTKNIPVVYCRILTPKEAKQGSSYRGGALHYSDAPPSELSPRAPHCTRRTGRKHKKRSGADRMIWITRLGTWIRENKVTRQTLRQELGFECMTVYVLIIHSPKGQLKA